MMKPRVSVLTAVYNGGSYLEESVQSILGQTFTDFEYIVVDDGSNDGSSEVLSRLAGKDPRLVVITHPINLGVVRALNRGLEVAQGEYIARQDADDISLPERLALQVAFLDRHPEVGLAGAVPLMVDMGLAPTQEVPNSYTATENEIIQATLLDYMCLCGPSVIMRREAFNRAGYYFSEGLDASEDYDLCLRLGEVSELANVDGGLYLYRQHPNSATRKREQMQVFNKATALERAIYRRYGSRPAQELFSNAARDYLQAAVIGFVRGDHQAARMSLECAVSLYPTLFDQDEPLERLVRVNTPHDSIENGLRYTMSIFDTLLPATPRLKAMRARLLSSVHMELVFAAAGQKHYRGLRHHLWQGIRYQPAWLLNEGVWAILARSLISDG